MADAGPERPPPADLAAAIAALPAKKEAAREAFDRLAACSSYPLPFTWEGLDAHISGIQSSISRRYRQLQVLEAARPAPAVPTSEATRSSGSQKQQQQQQQQEEEEEEEVEEEVEEEENDDDGEDEEGEEPEEEDEPEEEEEDVEEHEVEEEVVEEEEVEEEVVEEVEDATRDDGKQEVDKEMKLTNEQDQHSKEEPESTGKVEEQNADDEVLLNNKKKEVEQETGEEVHEEGKEELEEEKEPPLVEPGAKNADVSLKEDMVQNLVRRAPACGSKDLMTVCRSMNANTLVNFICCDRTPFGKDLPIAMRHAPDAAALALQVVKLFLSSKKFKNKTVWNKCVSLIRCVPVAASKPSVDTIEQAKQVAKDWKEIIYKLECPGNLELLGAWGLLYFLVSYNIVSEFDTSEIIRLFSMVPRHLQKKNTMELCKGLGLAHRIRDLIAYLIGKGRQLEVFHLAHVFNLSDEYPLLPLLKAYIETAKQTSMEIKSKSLNSAISKETENLWVAHHLAKKNITDSSQRGALMAEIKTLLDGYTSKKKRLAKTCTSNIQMQPKKCKKEEEELHKGLESLQQDQQNKVQEQEHRKNNAQQEQQKKESQMRENKQQQPKNRPQEREIQQHVKRPRPCKLPTPVVPVVLNAAQIGHFGHPPYSATPGVRGAPIFVLPLDAAQHRPPFNPFYPHTQFYPR